MKKIIAVLLLVLSFSFSVGSAVSYAKDWKDNKIKRIQEQQRRRAEELEKARTAQEAKDKARRMYYEEKRKQDLERRRYYQNKYGN